MGFPTYIASNCIFPSKLQLLHHAASLELKNGQAKKVYLVAHRHVNVALERRKGPDSRTLCARSGRRSKNEKKKTFFLLTV
jgi:hypothetical protein